MAENDKMNDEAQPESTENEAAAQEVVLVSWPEEIYLRLTEFQIPLIFAVPLRGIGQVIFCDSELTGAFFLAALFVGDPWLAVLALGGSAVGTFTAWANNFADGFIKMGLAGYNACLVGCAFAVFLPYEAWTWQPALATVVGSIIQAFITIACANMSAVPAWTFPFNYVVIGTFLYTQPFGAPSPPPTGPVYLTWSEVAAVDMVKAIPVGISQIFVVENWISGVLITVGLAWANWKLALSVVYGCTIGLLTAMALDASPSAITAGLWGYNPALMAAAACVFFQPTWQLLGLMTWSCVATQILSDALATAAGNAFKVPICTIPFSAMATVCFILRDHIYGYETPHDPDAEEELDEEAQLAAFLAKQISDFQQDQDNKVQGDPSEPDSPAHHRPDKQEELKIEVSV